ncbi:MAG: sensor domain-containing diguanylate cyclase [Treponema sp.]|nr:sensor domain-containing diguanylate cyclase [Treponema sp.]
MKPFFWVAVNIIGFVILIFMYINTDKTYQEKSHIQKLFRYLQLLILLYLIFDTGAFLLDGSFFKTAKIIHYIFNMSYYLIIPFISLIYLLYCDYKVHDNNPCGRKRLLFYLIPVLVNTIVVLSTPFTHMIFYIDQNNMYMRGSYQWISLITAFVYVIASYPLLFIKTKRKQALLPKGTNIYLYLFQLPPFITAFIQLFNYGSLILGMSFVISVYFMYVSNMQSSEDKRRLAVRFMNINITQFAVIAFTLIAGTLWTLENLIDDISKDYAKFNSKSAANVFNIYLNKEIGVLETASHSKAIIDWMCDENNIEKKKSAYDELISTLRVLYNNSMYVVVNESGNEYTIEGKSTFDNFQPFAAISETNDDDKWVFNLISSGNAYNLNVDIDKAMNRKRVWLNFKIMNENNIAGIICSGMEFDKVAGQAFSQYDSTKTRVLIIDENGVIRMDNSLPGNDNFILFENVKSIFDEMADPDFRTAARAHLESIDGYFYELNAEPVIINMNAGGYQYAAISPIGITNWSVVTFFDSSTLFNPSSLLPPLIITAVMFLIFLFSTNRITQRMIFKPLKMLVDSLLNMRKNNNEEIYGTERNDEIGLLSNTIHELFVKGHHDGLTGIYNRRYLEQTLHQIMTALSRAETSLGVMMIDVDFFKKYNDTYGHAQGDECLKAIAKTINGNIVRSGDFIARYGGEEFAVILPGTDETGAHIMAEKLLQAIRDLKMPHEENPGGIVTISIGVATGNTRALDWEEYIKKADEALYISKNSGRNRCTYLKIGS